MPSRDAALTRHAADERTTRLLLNTSTFGTAKAEVCVYDVVHPKHLNFNVECPTLPEFHRVAYDALWPLVDFEGDEDPLIARLPNGWDLQTLAQYEDLGTTELPLVHRAVWTLPVTIRAGYSIAHPHYDRLLTEQELQALNEGEAAMHAFIERQLQFCALGAWGSRDEACRYDAYREAWTIVPAAGVDKELDLSAYRPPYADRFEDADFEVKRFNLNSKGYPIRAWAAVEQYHLAWKRRNDVDSEVPGLRFDVYASDR